MSYRGLLYWGFAEACSPSILCNDSGASFQVPDVVLHSVLFWYCELIPVGIQRACIPAISKGSQSIAIDLDLPERSNTIGGSDKLPPLKPSCYSTRTSFKRNQNLFFRGLASPKGLPIVSVAPKAFSL